MAFLSETDAAALLHKVLSFSKADECQAKLDGGRDGNLRFARNAVSTSGESDTLSLEVQSSFGKRTGVTTINEFDDASLEKVVRRSEELAKLAPENPEYVPFLGPRTYVRPPSYIESSANLEPDFRATAAAASMDLCKKQGFVAAGFQSDSATFSAIANTKGLYGYQQRTGIQFSVTVRSQDSKSSGYAVADFNDASKLDTAALTSYALNKAVLSRDAKAIEPGKYTVVLEPAASVDLISHMISSMDARLADEGRSFLSKAGGGTRLGEKLMDAQVSIYSDPLSQEIPGDAWDTEGRPRARVDWIKEGVVANLAYSRYWAQKKGLQGDGTPGIGSNQQSEVGVFEGAQGFIMSGGTASTEELIKTVKRGVLVTRMWYIRPVDPQTLLFTGLTRDGTFYIEDGVIKYPIKNFRFNESPVIMLNNVEALGRPQRTNACLVPPMVLRDFTFSSLSDAV